MGWSLSLYLRKRFQQARWKREKRIKWRKEGISETAIKRRLKGHKILLKDGFIRSKNY